MRIFIVTLIILVWFCGQSGAEGIPRPEHPRPDFQRDAWLNLNGTWQFTMDPNGNRTIADIRQAKTLERSIVVPFCPESRLSQIGNTGFIKHLWYRRTFDVPVSMRNQRLLLHFGAVDWFTRVWLNGVELGDHYGGYSPFTFEITDGVKPQDNDLIVYVFDDTQKGTKGDEQSGGGQPRGKQSCKRQSYGCFYTRTSGIWQTVWLEGVGKSYLKDFVLRSDPDGARVIFTGSVDGAGEHLKVRLRAFAEGQPAGAEIVPARWRETIGVLNLKPAIPWQPAKPFLYQLVIEILQGDKVIDTVHTYFGLRKIEIRRNRIYINDRPIFLRLVLDQGYYPEGIYTASDDAALKRDIELALAAGFNGARLHQKVFEPRFLYWADRLGYLLWGEYGDTGVDYNDLVAVSYMTAEWQTILNRDRNHPSIIGWCPLNEVNQRSGRIESLAAIQRINNFIRLSDPSRMLLDTSGYIHLSETTDVYDSHDYTQDRKTLTDHYDTLFKTGGNPWNAFPQDRRSSYRGQPFLVSEFGGFRVKNQASADSGWGYGEELSVQDFLRRYKAMVDILMDNPNVAGFAYTQLTDVEQEQNGVYTYDRRSKYDPALLRVIHARKAACETR